MAGLVAAVVVRVICDMHYFLTFCLRNIFPVGAANNKSAMIVFFCFTVYTLPNAITAITVCTFLRGEHILYFLDLGHDDVG